MLIKNNLFKKLIFILSNWISIRMKKFKISIPEKVIEDLREKLDKIRWPHQLENSGWDRGTPNKYMKQLVEYWKEDYKWREHEQNLNIYDQYLCRIDNIDIHFYYIKGKGNRNIPLILSHGWPDSFLRYIKLIPFLTEPDNEGVSFDLIIPSLPGFGFSSAPKVNGINNARIADLWAKLMTKELGYTKFGAAGGDMGSGITRYLAMNYPELLIGIHLTDIGIIRDLMLPSKDKLSEEEIVYGNKAREWLAKEGAYISIQATKPHTLAYGLSDSPVSLAAWIIEKLYSWSDCTNTPEELYSKDEILTQIMIYWVTNTLGSSLQMYYENMNTLPPLCQINVPTGIAIFPKDILIPPRSWAEKKLNIIRWTEMRKGGHFTAMEVPKEFAEDIKSFFKSL